MTTIVEIGAHNGAETFNFLGDASANVYAFEPDAKKFRALVKQSRQYPRLTLLPFAVDIGDNQEPLFQHPDGLSTLQPNFFGPAPSSYSMVWTIRLDSFMYLYDVEKIDYLRIDAPQREEMCLESLGARIKDVERGRIRQYGSETVIPAWLLDHGFNIEKDTTSANITEPDIRFWRT